MKKNYNIKEKIIKINKVSKPNKGLIVLRYNVFVIIGDMDGGYGYSKIKCKDQNIGIKKAFLKARYNFKKIFLKNGTIQHEIIGKFCSSKILIIPAKKGIGIVAGGFMRSLFHIIGIENIISKLYGSKNINNVIKATFSALDNINRNYLFFNKIFNGR